LLAKKAYGRRESKKRVSVNVLVDNRDYRDHLNSKFDATPIDMEIVDALVCFQYKIPFIVIRALSDFPGGGSALSNEASIFLSLASQNAFHVLVKFISLL
jgi:nucleoside phosphorylase